MSNWEPQNQDRNDDTQHSSIIKFPHLTELNLLDVHDDYVEQFLLDTKTCLLNSIYLLVNVDQLKRVTHDFTRDATRLNCAKVESR